MKTALLSAAALLLAACASNDAVVHVNYHEDDFLVKAFEGKTLSVSVAENLEADERMVARSGLDKVHEAGKLRKSFVEALAKAYPGAKVVEADPAIAALFAGFNTEENQHARTAPASAKAATDAAFASLHGDFLFCVNLARYGIARIPKGSNRPPPVSLTPQGITFTIPLGPEGTEYEDRLNLYANLEVWEKKSRRKKISLISGTHFKPSGEDYKPFLERAPGEVAERFCEYLKNGGLPKQDD